jgi:hypothetical protein
VNKFENVTGGMRTLTTTKKSNTGHQWLTPVIVATKEAVIRSIAVQSQPRQIDLEIPSQKYTT